MNRNVLCAALAASFVGAPASAQVFLDRSNWVTAAGGAVTTPDYSVFAPVDFVPGVSFDMGGFFDVLATGGSTGDADLNNVPNFVFDFSPGGLSSVTFSFDTEITAFAGLWSNTFVQDGFAVTTGNGNTYDLGALGGGAPSAAFIGIVEATAFDSVTFTTATPGGDDFVFFREFEFVSVPAPASAALLGLGAIAGVRRRR